MQHVAMVMDTATGQPVREQAYVYMCMNAIMASLWTGQDLNRKSEAERCITAQLLLSVGLVGFRCCGRGMGGERGMLVFWSSAKFRTRGREYWDRALCVHGWQNLLCPCGSCREQKVCT